MNEPQLILVTLSHLQARQFCDVQGIEYSKVVSFATDNQIMPQHRRYLTGQDAVVWYGPWTEGRHWKPVVDVVYSLVQSSSIPFEYTAYMYQESIPWPEQIAERYLRDHHN